MTPTEIWSAAKAADLGITVITDDLALARQQLYESEEAELEEFSLFQWPDRPNELWIARRRLVPR